MKSVDFGLQDHKLCSSDEKRTSNRNPTSATNITKRHIKTRSSVDGRRRDGETIVVQR